MNEDLLYFIWKYRLYNNFIGFNFDGAIPEILDCGIQNFDAGPDFIEAKIKTDETMWVGNVEIHVKSSDWNLHKHQFDKAYNNVILQVVNKHDKDVYTEDGRLLPVIEIDVTETIITKYKDYVENKNWIPCEKDISLIDGFKLKMWLNNVLVERLNKKSELVTSILNSNKNSWEETFYQFLARSFGFKINADPFEWLAKSIPLKYLAKHQNNLMQLEAILFGQAGFLAETDSNTEYFNLVKNEYEFLSKKFGLKPIDRHLWKFLRLRPSNFPYIRISQFAALIQQSNSLFSKVIASNILELKEIFKVQASGFWDNHYTFEKMSKGKSKILGEQSINSIIINTIIPILFVYGKHFGDTGLQEKAIQFLDEIKPESNKIIKEWMRIKVSVPSSFYSQALLEQKKSYCDLTKCLKCGIGIEIFKKQLTKQ